MLGLETISFQFGRYAPVVLFAIATFLAFETIFVVWLQRHHRKSHINERLRTLDRSSDSQAAFVELLRKRGLTGAGEYILPLVTFNRLVMQSGISIPIVRLIILMISLGAGTGIGSYVALQDPLLAVLFSIGAGVVLPIAILFALRVRRKKAFENQLPEAIDVMVRSMKAGHPLPVAISMVAREMPDPCGTEFGLVADEMTYGLDLNTAMSNMRVRAGQSDLAFLVVATSIQSTTGGNLAEILVNLSSLVRERAKMRRKIHSLSAEGRFSALALSIIPCVVLVSVAWTTPSYYGDVSSDPLFMPAIYTGLTIWTMGIFVIFRMINLKI